MSSSNEELEEKTKEAVESLVKVSSYYFKELLKLIEKDDILNVSVKMDSLLSLLNDSIVLIKKLQIEKRRKKECEQ